MNEKEIIKDLKNFIALAQKEENFIYYSEYKFDNELAERVQELLNLYNKEKEKNNSISIQYEKVVDKLEALEQIEKEHKEENGRLREEIDKKDKIIDKLITELTAVNSGRYEYMDNDRVLGIFTNKVEEDK